MAVQKITDLWKSVEELVITQFKDSTALLDIVSKVVRAFQSPEDAANVICDRLNINTASGAWLDLVGKIRNVAREKGQSDEDYRQEILFRLGLENDGTASFALKMASKLSSDPAPVLHEEVPGVFFIYTPNGRQLTRSAVKRMAPAGVLGVPGAIFVADRLDENGIRRRKKLKFLNGKTSMGVARLGLDDGIRRGHLLDDNGNFLMDDNGNRLTYEIKKWYVKNGN